MDVISQTIAVVTVCVNMEEFVCQSGRGQRVTVQVPTTLDTLVTSVSIILYALCFMPLTKLLVDIQICTSLYLRTSPNLVCAIYSSYTLLWILFILTHSGQHDMKMTVKTGMLQVLHKLLDFVILFRYTCCLFRLPHSLSPYYLDNFFNKVNPLHDCKTIVLGCLWGASVSYRHISSSICSK